MLCIHSNLLARLSSSGGTVTYRLDTSQPHKRWLKWAKEEVSKVRTQIQQKTNQIVGILDLKEYDN